MPTDTTSAWPMRALAIREQIEPEAVLDALGLASTMRSGGQMPCPNPAHHDHHPSARFYPEGGKVHCFTCGQTWDSIALVSLIHGVPFPDAVVWLEETFGVATVGDATMVAAVLRRRGMTDCSGLVTMVEAAVQAARPRCTVAQYARLWRAYDVARHSYGLRKIDEATFVAALDRVLALTPP